MNQASANCSGLACRALTGGQAGSMHGMKLYAIYSGRRGATPKARVLLVLGEISTTPWKNALFRVGCPCGDQALAPFAVARQLRRPHASTNGTFSDFFLPNGQGYLPIRRLFQPNNSKVGKLGM